MQLTIMGKREVSYTRKGTSELVEGIELYYVYMADGIEGFGTDKLWIAKNSRFHAMVLEADFSEPVAANLVREVLPGSNFPQMTEFVLKPEYTLLSFGAKICEQEKVSEALCF
jgi:hypothetical protein